MTTIHLDPNETQALYQILDQVSVRGVQAKATVVVIMAKLEEAAKPKEEKGELASAV